MTDSPQRFLPVLGYAKDAYDFDTKIMGRQSYGRGLIKALGNSYFNQVDLVALDPTQVDPLNRFLERLNDCRFRQITIESFYASGKGTLLYPGVAPRSLAKTRRDHPTASFSIISITHSLSSLLAYHSFEDQFLAPFLPWDGIIETSSAASEFLNQIESSVTPIGLADQPSYFLSNISRRKIPLAVDDSLIIMSWNKTEIRKSLGILDNEFVLLSPGRQSFHSKANPWVLYSALAQLTQVRPVTLIMAGKYPNEFIRQAYRDAAKQICPEVKVLEWTEDPDYEKSWKVADVMVSLSDNIQETFGLTLLEALAHGLPCIVSDWSGYRDIVKNNVTGFVVPTIFPGHDSEVNRSIVSAYITGNATYDMYIGRLSCLCSVDKTSIIDSIYTLMTQEDLRLQFSENAREAAKSFAWSATLLKYQAFASHLSVEKSRLESTAGFPKKNLINKLYSHFATHKNLNHFNYILDAGSGKRLESLKSLTIATYAYQGNEQFWRNVNYLVQHIRPNKTYSAQDLLALAAESHNLDSLMWLIKFGVLTAQLK